MRKRVKKKCRDREILQNLNWIINYTCGEVTGSCKRLQGLLSEMNSKLSRFPMVVKDWATEPPVHNGEYIIWFVRKGQDPHSRKYTYAAGKWHDSQGNEIDIRQYKPSMWLLLPTFSPDVLEVYRRRSDGDK